VCIYFHDRSSTVTCGQVVWFGGQKGGARAATPPYSCQTRGGGAGSRGVAAAGLSPGPGPGPGRDLIANHSRRGAHSRGNQAHACTAARCIHSD
jgi:hypothetical protein